MKLTWFSEYAARPGELVEWVLHPATLDAATEAPQDLRPPSYMQEGHMRTAALLHDLDVDAPTWIGTAFDIEGALDRASLEAALLKWFDRHETLRSGLRSTQQALERFTLSSAAVKLQRGAVRHFSDGADVVAHLEARFDEATNPLTWPPYVIVTVAREHDFTVYLAFDHSNVDGYSIVLLPHEIHELYAAARDERPARLGEANSYVDFSQIERQRADTVQAEDESVVRWRGFIESGDGRLPCFPLDLGVGSGELPAQTGVCEWLLDPSDANAFNLACKRHGGNFLAGILATASIVAHERGGEPTYRTVIPFHTRSDARWAASLGWYIGLAPIEIATYQARDFRELVGMARDAVRAARPISQVPLARVWSLLGVALAPKFVVSYMDGRMVPGAGQWQDWRAHAFGKVSYGDEVYMWVNRAVSGLYVTSRYPSTDVADKNIMGYIDGTRDVLLAVARSGGYALSHHLPAKAAG